MLEQSFTVHMPLTKAASAFGLGRECKSSPQWCYLQRLCTISIIKKHIHVNLLAWYGKKLNLTQQKHTVTYQKKCTTQNKHKKLKPGSVASYDIRPRNGEGPFLSRRFTNLLLTYLDTYPLTYSPGHTRGTCLATDLDESSSHLQSSTWPDVPSNVIHPLNLVNSSSGNRLWTSSTLCWLSTSMQKIAGRNYSSDRCNYLMCGQLDDVTSVAWDDPTNTTETVQAVSLRVILVTEQTDSHNERENLTKDWDDKHAYYYYHYCYLYTGMLILGLGLKAKFLGLGILWAWCWPWAFCLGLGLVCSGLGINNKANRHII